MAKGAEAHIRAKIQPVAVQAKRQAREAKQHLLLMLWSMRKRNPLLFWGSIVTMSMAFGASVALFTPIWPNSNTFNQERQFTGQGFIKRRSPVDFWADVSQYQISRPVNILLMGIDPPENTANNASGVFAGSSDTMLLVRLDPTNQSIKVLSIPKDSQVVIPEIGLEKISLANVNGGPALAARVVSRTLNNVPIDRYVRITTNAFEELINALGGVEVFVPQQMSYIDATQQLEINLAAGWQTLDGDQAQQFARFRNSNVGDLERLQRQQMLLKAIRDRLTSPTVLPILPKLARSMQSYIDSNLSLIEMLALVNFGITVEPQNFQMVLVPGSLSPLSLDPSSYWLDGIGINRVMSEYFDVKPLGGMQASHRRSLTSLKIAVQNASGDPSLSDRVTKYLRERGFERVYTVSDWLDSQRQTQVVAQQGNLTAATDLQQILGLGIVEPTATGNLDSHLTIRIGQDWTQQL
ncbi:LCP family protein [Gloeocapsopsis dulcis]|uniref:Transcriptional regulator n=1 Tax=Gloeocapsopsis dulcis AAB1 = 1H9 TaxID=1433147 RepID=A0A6N8FYX2_9CHRO|nr:LCP family protein [Gloeocapsopsis dulcis]MUL38338.1 transcriptional regulator [Gloeocapsopsis dulcis AAB1 = 1H9]WNN91164.1 LCP family protein [Gloeocapsopsis dulcis]